MKNFPSLPFPSLPSLSGFFFHALLCVGMLSGMPLTQSYAQGNCNWLTDFSITIVPVLPGNSPSTPGCPAPDCDEVMYEVYVQTNNSAYTVFEYSWLSIVGRVNTNGTSTYIETVASREDCSPNYTPAEFSVENDPGGFGIVSLDLGDPFNPAFPAALGQTIPLVNGSALLFTVVIHATPGVPISWSNPFYAQNPALNPYFSATYKHNTAGPNCSGEMQVGFGSNLSPNLSMPTPSACASPVGYYFNVPQQVQSFQNVSLFNAVQVPIVLSGLTPGTVIEEIEAVVEVKTSNYMEFGNVTSDIFPCLGGILNPANCSIKIREYDTGGFIYKEISGLTTNVTISSANALLMNLYLIGPLNESLGDCAEITLKSLKIKINGVCCSPQFSTQSGKFPAATICFQGEQSCDDYNISVTEITGSNDCEIAYRVALDWFNPLANITFDRIKFRIRFGSDNPLAVSIANNTLCNNGCVTVTQISTTLYEITANINNSTVTKGGGFDLVFGGQQGCISGFLFFESLIKPTGFTQCVPQLLPPYTVGSYSRCFARLGGNIEYEMTQDCDDYLILANPASGSPQGCQFIAIKENGASPWSFCACNTGFPYTVSCSKVNNGNPLNNVSTYDQVLISKHTLGIEPFNNTFKEVAADANSDGIVAPFDIVEIRKLILGIYTNLPHSHSYKILGSVPPQQNINYGQGNSPYNTSSFIKSIATASDDVKFYSVKTGDVSWNNVNHPMACLTNDDPTQRIGQSIPLSLMNDKEKSGNIVRVPVLLKDNWSSVAWQLGVQFDPNRLQYVGLVQSDDLSGEVFIGSTKANDGALRMNWFDETGTPVPLESGSTLCFLEFYALTDLSDQEISLTAQEEDFISVGFDVEGSPMPFVLEKNVNAQDLDMQIRPNPFEGNANLSFNLQEEGKISLSIHDLRGALVGNLELFLSSGRQQLLLTDKDFGNLSGLFMVTLNTEVETKTVIVVKQ